MLIDEIQPHYGLGMERDRLAAGVGRLELVRTQDILKRYLPGPPAVVADIGGGPGAYALWLAHSGYRVHLIDLVPLHVQQALLASGSQPHHPLCSATVGDARNVPLEDCSCDAVLMLGPLYHLTESSDRLKAWSEARRVARHGGVIIAAAISRFASALDGLARGLIDDPEFVSIMKRDLQDGQHRNSVNHPAYFTTAYFHRAQELRDEAIQAALEHLATIGVEGPAWLLGDFDARWDDLRSREILLNIVRSIELEPSIIGVSAHLLAIARNP